MKIIEDTPERLVVEHVPVAGMIALAVCAFAGFGMAIWAVSAGPWFLVPLALAFGALPLWLLMAMGRLRVTLDRSSGRAVVARHRPRGAVVMEAPLPEITGVEAEVMQGHKGPLYRLRLMRGEAEPLPFGDVLYNGGNHPEVQQRISAWLAEAGESSPGQQ